MPTKEWTYSYEDLVRITGMDLDTVYQHKARKNFDPGKLESVLIWLGRHAKPAIRQELVRYSLDYYLGLKSPAGKSSGKKSKTP